MADIVKLVTEIVKLPFVALLKILVTMLNLIPTCVYEVHGVQGFDQVNRPDLRALKINIQDRRRAHLGTVLVAWTRGAVFKATLNTNGASCWGIYSEDYQDIQRKWVW